MYTMCSMYLHSGTMEAAEEVLEKKKRSEMTSFEKYHEKRKMKRKMKKVTYAVVALSVC